METIKIKYTAVCDWCDGKRACCASWESASEEYDDSYFPRGPLVSKSRKEAKSYDWFISDDVTLCPEHNTTTNRKKKFPEPQLGSLASIVRRVRS